MSIIKIEKTGFGFSIQFPYELKDKFRDVFPSAKWNSGAKIWMVGPRSGKRLEQWVAAVQKSRVIEEIETRDERDLFENELGQIQEELARIRNRIEEEQRRKESAEEIKATMEATKATLQKYQRMLAEVKREADAEMAKMAAVRNDVEATLRQAIDLDAVLAAQRKMGAVARQVGSTARERWNEGQSVMKAARDQLRAAGLISYGISALAGANHNRPDRDHPNNVTLEKILQVVEREDDD